MAIQLPLGGVFDPPAPPSDSDSDSWATTGDEEPLDPRRSEAERLVQNPAWVHDLPLPLQRQWSRSFGPLPLLPAPPTRGLLDAVPPGTVKTLLGKALHPRVLWQLLTDPDYVFVSA